MLSLQLLVASLIGWFQRGQSEIIELFLLETAIATLGTPSIMCRRRAIFVFANTEQIHWT